ncbi:hypothetical protein O6H91_23G064000 [Diphasiastrum complanatum]|uniref:Uncharacterized protein n=2 Tax=Diphasiastrum complanatum TaxID=34168 RepID=A0ACC2ABE2_DIPCM|nr:hypothetical protein O6H91_23G064000 [Diphasiastrum complanatum]
MKRKAAPPTSVLIGNCRVQVPAKLQYKQTVDSVKVRVPYTGEISISVEDTKKSSTAHNLECDNIGQKRRGPEDMGSCSFVLLNPKSLDSKGHSLLQEVLKLYNEELPAMSYAANTGKESPFLEKCVTTGKYCTLLLRQQTTPGETEVVGAVTYQILPPDTQYAEIPLAAVAKKHQRKGYGAALYAELERRLQAVGVVTVFCWGDQESECFWIRLGFLTVAEVDGRGKPRKLPIKPDVRRAMSIPGSATLMVSHISTKTVDLVCNDAHWNDIAATPLKLSSFGKSNVFETLLPSLNWDAANKDARASPALAMNTPTLTETKPHLLITPSASMFPMEPEYPGHKNISPLNIAGALSSVACGHPTKGLDTMVIDRAEHQSGHQELGLHGTTVTFSPRQAGSGIAEIYTATNGSDLDDVHEVAANRIGDTSGKENYKPTEAGADPDVALSVQPSNRPVRKRGRGRRCSAALNENRSVRGKNVSKIGEMKSCSIRLVHEPSLEIQKPGENANDTTIRSIVDELTTASIEVVKDTKDLQHFGRKSEMLIAASEDYQREADNTSVPTDQHKHVIMFMNMANEERRIQLSKFVEKLGGSVTNNGSECTHVITGEVRRTFNFCAAICTGAWVVSPEWLKASVKSNNFVEECPYFLKDKQFESKYKTTLEAVVRRAKQKPRLLLDGFSIYVTKHVQPPIESIQQLISLAGGKVLLDVHDTFPSEDFSHTFIIACEEDMSEALAAAKEGLLTYTSEWIMSSIMKQDLDLTASQFTESLQ